MILFYCILCIILAMEEYENSVYSQQGEDGVIARIFDLIGTDTKFCVDIGAYDGRITSNVMALEDAGWSACKLEGSDIADTEEAKKNGVKRHYVTAENVVSLMEKYEVPKSLDFLSLDIDSIDYHVLKGFLGGGWSPRAICTEYNATYGPILPVVTKYPLPEHLQWGDYYGASLAAFYYLLKDFGYRLVYCEKEGVNAFWVKDDLATPELPELTPAEAYKPPQYGKKDRWDNWTGHEHLDGWMEFDRRGIYE